MGTRGLASRMDCTQSLRPRSGFASVMNKSFAADDAEVESAKDVPQVLCIAFPDGWLRG